MHLYSGCRIKIDGAKFQILEWVGEVVASLRTRCRWRPRNETNLPVRTSMLAILDWRFSRAACTRSLVNFFLLTAHCPKMTKTFWTCSRVWLARPYHRATVFAITNIKKKCCTCIANFISTYMSDRLLVCLSVFSIIFLMWTVFFILTLSLTQNFSQVFVLLLLTM